MIHNLLQTDADFIYLFVRVIAGLTIFPYGMQKLMGWFEDFGGGVGIRSTLLRMREKKIPLWLAWLIIIGQSAGSVALILGFLGRIAAGANFIIFTGALLVHAPDGWIMNWTGKKKGEGIEYFILLLSLLLIVIIKGSGPLSIDRWLFAMH
ncbi:MAG TPA: DoxX family protein [Puia sp.]|jgi:putative oxidoreductase